MESLILVSVLLILNPPIVAQAAAEAGPWLTGANLGLAGIFLWAFVTGKIHSDKELQRVISRCDDEFKRVAGKLDAAEAELRTINAEALHTLVPTLTKTAVLLSRFVDRQDNTPNPPNKGRG